jgi:hypothetical protein
LVTAALEEVLPRSEPVETGFVPASGVSVPLDQSGKSTTRSTAIEAGLGQPADLAHGTGEIHRAIWHRAASFKEAWRSLSAA